MLKLYDFEGSGNCYKIRLLLALLGRDYQRVPIDSTKGETVTPEFLQLNPRGQIPVLEDDGEVLWDSLAILVYLARRYGDGRWLPSEALAEARVMQWLAVSENELLYGLARARAVLKFGRPFDLQDCQQLGRQALELLDGHLADREWLAAEHPTIADIACYAYVGLAPEAAVPLEPFPAVCAWLERIQTLLGYVGMPGLWAPG